MARTLVRLGLIAAIVAAVLLTGCTSEAGVSLPAGDSVLHLDSVVVSNKWQDNTTKSGYVFAAVMLTGTKDSFDSDAAEADYAGLDEVSDDVSLSAAEGSVGELYYQGWSTSMSDGEPSGYELYLVFVVPADAGDLTLNWPDKDPIDLAPYMEQE